MIVAMAAPFTLIFKPKINTGSIIRLVMAPANVQPIANLGDPSARMEPLPAQEWLMERLSLLRWLELL